MTKTQIQLPDELYRDLKRLAAAKEWSLAETLRRGAELLLASYAESPISRSTPWSPPTSTTAGWRGLTAEQLRDLANDDESGRSLEP